MSFCCLLVSLACLDQVTHWLDTIDATGELPTGSEGPADALVAHFGSRREHRDGDRANAAEVAGEWIREALARHAAVAPRAITAIRLIPDPDAFYRGEDPVAQMSSLPDLLALDLQPASAWPPLSALDPFACNLVLTALTASATADVVASSEPGSSKTNSSPP